MGVLKQHQPKVQRVYMPSTKELPIEQQDWVDLDVSELRAADISSIEGKDRDRTLNMIAARIQDWSFTTEDGSSKAAITAANLGEFPFVDFQALSDTIDNNAIETEGLSEDQKKS